MIHATLSQDGQILLRADSNDGTTAARLYGSHRTKDMPPSTFLMPLTPMSIKELRRVGALGTSELRREVLKLNECMEYVKGMKDTQGAAKPLRPVPIKAGMSLYNHQVKAFNIALALMGYDTKEVTPNEHV